MTKGQLMEVIQSFLDKGYRWEEVVIAMREMIRVDMPKTWQRVQTYVENDTREREALIEVCLQRFQYTYYSVKAKTESILSTDAVVEAGYREMCGTENPGFCIACGAENDGCEPDASFYTCEECGLPMVFAPAEIIMRGLCR